MLCKCWIKKGQQIDRTKMFILDNDTRKVKRPQMLLGWPCCDRTNTTNCKKSKMNIFEENTNNMRLTKNGNVGFVLVPENRQHTEITGEKSLRVKSPKK